VGNYGGLGTYGSLGVYGNLGGPVSGTTWDDLPTWESMLTWFVPGPGTPTAEIWDDLPTWGQLETWFTVDPTPTVTRYYLTSPVREVGQASRDRYTELLRNRTGLTVVKRNGQWLTVRNRRQEWLDDCDVVLRGGYDNEVTGEQKTELEAAGFTVETRIV